MADCVNYLLQGGNALPSEGGIEPTACIQLSERSQGMIPNLA
jgi:hypothetical protein